MRGYRLAALACLSGLAMQAAAPASSAIAEQGCAVLAGRVDAIPGSGPVFLRSYDGDDGRSAPDQPALATVAFTYDNALAAIALTACGRTGAARRIGRALSLAATHDRAGRLRNGYRAGAQEPTPLPNGWWDGDLGRWLEDDYQLGSGSGNLAWAGLALMTLAAQGGAPADRQTAALLARWVIDHAGDDRGSGGFSGGLFGNDAAPQKLDWKSTEHNVDLAALFAWLRRDGLPGDWEGPEKAARRFIDSQWDAGSGHFLTGTLTDGVTANRQSSGLDAQVWPMLLPDAAPDWRRALDYAERAHGVGGGFSFNDDRSGLWTEGTAQASLAFRAAGNPQRAESLLAVTAGLTSPGGYLWATAGGRVATGLALRPDSRSADFFYDHRPHLGATAWAVLAALGWNPFTGKTLR